MKRKRREDEFSESWRDSTRKRIEVRLAFLGWTHARLGVEVGKVDGRPPLLGGSVRNYLCGRRAWRRGEPGGGLADPIDRFAAALRVPVAALEVGGPWEDLISDSEARLCA